MKFSKIFFPTILIILSVFLYTLDLSSPPSNNTNNYQEILEGTITNVKEVTHEYQGETEIEQNLMVNITKGSEKGTNIEVQNSDTQSLDAQLYEQGDRVIVLKSISPEGKTIFSISDYIRRPTLYILFGAFLLVVLLVSRRQGLESFIGMAFSFLVLFKWILPLLLKGYDPVLTAISGALLIIPATFYLSHGVNRKTHLAILGTLITLILTGIFSKLCIDWAQLSGLSDDAAIYLKADTGNTLHFQGLLLAGILISMLGILDDITISQASVAEQLKKAKPGIHFGELYTRTMEVGKDHIASVVNTLILIYAGSSLPLLLLFLDNAHSFSEVINYEFLAEEIVQSLIASMGLILAVPITTLLASLSKNRS